jgi:LPXTG-site transpeptidase (sortase) family protein
MNFKQLIKRNDFLFIVGFGLTFFVTLSIFSVLGFIPKEIADTTTGPGAGISLESQSNTSLFGVDFTKENVKISLKTSEISIEDLPARIVIEKVGIDFKIVNPDSTSLTFLDNELTKAPVRYPGSGTITSGNMFIFGHSTGLKIVQNQAYKVFNNLKNLKEGDQIKIYSMAGKTYTYTVVDGKDVKKSETWIDFSAATPTLTLSTCDRLSEIGDRYVVKAVKNK